MVILLKLVCLAIWMMIMLALIRGHRNISRAANKGQVSNHG